MSLLARPLDALWARLPLPARTVARPVQIGPLPALEMYRSVFGRPLMRVYAYRFGDTLVDTGFPSDAVVGWAREGGARVAVLTHHHEDHAGNAAALAEAGVDVRATELTRALIERPLPIPFYEHLAWGKPRAASPALLPDSFDVGGLTVEVLPAAGHCVDQVCLWVPERGWLFSGDVFLHERVRLFRRDEDFGATLDTLRRLAALPIDTLFCAHRPRVERGAAALAEKLAWMTELEQRVRDLAVRGLAPRRIARELGLANAGGFVRLSFGDASGENIVRSILFGPRPRAGVQGALLQLRRTHP